MATCRPGHHTFPVCSSIGCVTNLCFILYLSPMSCSSSEESHLLPSQIENLDRLFLQKGLACTHKQYLSFQQDQGNQPQSDLHGHLSLENREPFQPQAPRPSVLTEGSFPLRQSLAHRAFPVAQDMFCLMDSGLYQKDLILLNFAQP